MFIFGVFQISVRFDTLFSEKTEFKESRGLFCGKKTIFGDATGFGKISGSYFSLIPGVELRP